jgi:hypothetical protein
MEHANNPFAPGAGTPPPELAGRQEILAQARVSLERIKNGRAEKSMFLVGLRGVGKTVLLNEIDTIANEKGYITAFIEATEDKRKKRLPELLLPHLRRILLKLDTGEMVSTHVKKALRAFQGFMSQFKLQYDSFEFKVAEPEKGVADSGDLEVDLAELFVAIGEAAASRKTAVAIIIDELQYLEEKELSALIMAVHRISQKGLPLIVVGAGLPQLVGKAGNSKSYAERLFTYPQVGKLKREDAIIALQKPAQQQGVAFTADALEQIVLLTQGYPYFLQEWGYHAWNTAKQSPITKADIDTSTPITLQKLDDDFFRVRFDRLTPSEKRYVRALAALGGTPQRSGDIAEKLGVKVNSIAPLRAQLITKGMIYSPSHGDTAFTVPLFEEFLKRVMPDFS